MVGRIGLNPLPRWVNVIWGKTANAWLDVVWPTGAGLSKDHRLIYPGGLRPIRPSPPLRTAVAWNNYKFTKLRNHLIIEFAQKVCSRFFRSQRSEKFLSIQIGLTSGCLR